MNKQVDFEESETFLIGIDPNNSTDTSRKQFQRQWQQKWWKQNGKIKRASKVRIEMLSATDWNE